MQLDDVIKFLRNQQKDREELETKISLEKNTLLSTIQNLQEELTVEKLLQDKLMKELKTLKLLKPTNRPESDRRFNHQRTQSEIVPIRISSHIENFKKHSRKKSHQNVPLSGKNTCNSNKQTIGSARALPVSVKRSLRHLVGTQNGKLASSWSKSIFHAVKRSSNSGGINGYLK